MLYYKLLDVEGNVMGLTATPDPLDDPEWILITYEEYLAHCEALGWEPR